MALSTMQVNATLRHLQSIKQIIQPTVKALGESCLQCSEDMYVLELRMVLACFGEANSALLPFLCVRALSGPLEEARMCFPSQLRMWPDIRHGNELGIPREMFLFLSNIVTGKVAIFILPT